MSDTYHGRIVNLEKTDDGNLFVHLNNNGQRILSEIKSIRDRLGGRAALRIILDDHLKRRWTEIRPEKVGVAETAAIILSDEAVRDSGGVFSGISRAYQYERFQVEDPIEELAQNGFVQFDGVGGD